MENSKFTNIQEEKIYACYDIENNEKIDEKISLFFSELLERKRDIPFEGGLQAGIVLLSDCCAMKVCENDGIAPHLNTFVNLIKYLNNDDKYISLNGIGHFNLYRDELNQLNKDAIQIRILDGMNDLMLAIITRLSELTEYQTEILKKILLSCKTLKDNKKYDQVLVGFSNGTYKNEVEDLDDKHYESVLSTINNLQGNLTNSRSIT